MTITPRRRVILEWRMRERVSERSGQHHRGDAGAGHDSGRVAGEYIRIAACVVADHNTEALPAVLSQEISGQSRGRSRNDGRDSSGCCPDPAPRKPAVPNCRDPSNASVSSAMASLSPPQTHRATEASSRAVNGSGSCASQACAAWTRCPLMCDAAGMGESAMVNSVARDYGDGRGGPDSVGARGDHRLGILRDLMPPEAFTPSLSPTTARMRATSFVVAPPPPKPVDVFIVGRACSQRDQAADGLLLVIEEAGLENHLHRSRP